MHNPNTEKFYQLIRRNRGSSGHETSSIVVEGNEIFFPESHRKVFAK